MMSLHWNTVTDYMRNVLIGFMQSDIGEQFYLAGGTALSLQLGHRTSIDLDFFSPIADIPSVRIDLETALAPFNGILADSSWGNLVFLAGDVRLGFYGYGFPLVAPLIKTEGISLASKADIALMKLDALLSRASRKDFYDLYFICQELPLRNLYDLAAHKYKSVRDFESQTIKRLVYFENAEIESDPLILKPISWNAVKSFFIQQAKEIEQSWLE